MLIDIALMCCAACCVGWFADWYVQGDRPDALWKQVDIRLCVVAVIILWGTKFL